MTSFEGRLIAFGFPTFGVALNEAVEIFKKIGVYDVFDLNDCQEDVCEALLGTQFSEQQRDWVLKFEYDSTKESAIMRCVYACGVAS